MISSTILFLTWFVPLVGVVVQVLIIVAFYGIIKHFGNCPTCGRRIPNKDAICGFCGTERLTKGVDPAAFSFSSASESTEVSGESVEGLVRIDCRFCGKGIMLRKSDRYLVEKCPYCQKPISARQNR